MTTLDHVHGMQTALAELGYDPDTVQHPTAEDARRWPGVDVMVRTSVVPLGDAWKAGALVRLTLRGADSPSRCLTASGPGWAHPCPEHPVGALLAGTDPGCTPTP